MNIGLRAGASGSPVGRLHRVLVHANITTGTKFGPNATVTIDYAKWQRVVPTGGH